MANLPTHLIPADALRRLAAGIFAAGAGCDAAEADRIAFYLVGANLTGHDSHGVIRVPRYVEDVEGRPHHPGQVLQGRRRGADPRRAGRQFGFGQTIGPQAVDIGIAKAKATGLRRRGAAPLRPYRPHRRLGRTRRGRRAGLVAFRQCRQQPAGRALRRPRAALRHQSGLHRHSADRRPADAAARHGHLGGGRRQGHGGGLRAASRCRKAR